MRVQNALLWIAVAGTLASWSPPTAVGQQLAFAPRTPRFFYAPSTAAKPVEIDISENAVLGQVVSLQLKHSTIGGFLAEIQRQTGLIFAYDHAVPATRSVTLQAESITVAAALAAILVGTGVDVVLTPTRHVWLTESKWGPSRVQEGTIAGRVTDKGTGGPIMGATVILDPSGSVASTGADGRYRFANLALDSYEVRARYIGYTPMVASVALTAGQEVIVDFVLEKSAQHLEQIVTTGTLVPMAVKALASPVNVVTSADFEQRSVQRMDQVFRQFVPSAVAWNLGVDVQQTVMSVRGASSLSAGAGAMKVYLDGVEITDRTIAAIDPSSIERVEVIRGPQAAAVYGSGAIGGVMQVFSKRGDPTRPRPQVNLQAGWGVIESPYQESSGALRQEYVGSVRGATPSLSYSFGGGYARSGDWVIEGGTSTPSAYGGVRFNQGALAVDVSGRYFVQNTATVLDPRLTQTGFGFASKPFHWDTQWQEQTYGVRFNYAPVARWQNTLVVGIDRLGTDIHSTRPRLTTPSDTLLFVQTRNRSKASFAYHSSLSFRGTDAISGSLAAGIDHYALRSQGYFTLGALSTTGTIATAPTGPLSGTRDVTTNTGYFTELQLGLWDALFLTGALRIDDHSDFGPDLGAPLSPRVGAAYARQIGGATVKLRASYGEAIQPPDPGRKDAAVFATTVRLANPNLGPERQKGWDAGVDLAFGSRGSLSVTYYNQSARDLIQLVQVNAGSTPQQQQYQNVGLVKNLGLEIEGTLTVGSANFRAQYSYTRSRVDELGPNYSGDLRVSDQALLIPRHTGGASLTITPFSRTSITAGATYVGSWRYYDTFAQYSCFGGTAPCRPSNRDYIVDYPAFLKVNASVRQAITSLLSGFISVENLTNSEASELGNTAPVMGRVTMAGLRLQY